MDLFVYNGVYNFTLSFITFSPRLRAHLHGCTGPAAGLVPRQHQPAGGSLPADGAEAVGSHGPQAAAARDTLGEAAFDTDL